MTTRYFYDTEFIDDGKTIDLISIGIACEDGREYYAVNAEAPWPRITEHEWLMANVVPHLPRAQDLVETGGERTGFTSRLVPGRWSLDFADPTFRPKNHIAIEIRDFLLGDLPEGTDVELWADYAAYDHVALAQLWGTMINLPKGIPMYTNDIQTYARLSGISHKDLPKQAGNEHHALADARNVWDRYTYIRDNTKRSHA